MSNKLPFDPTTTELIQRVYAAVDFFMTNLESQDSVLTIEMSQAMLNDIIETGAIKPMIDYVRRYCDCADSEDEIFDIAESI